MIPLRDDVPSRTVPVVNYVLIALNVFAFVLEPGLGEQLPQFLAQAQIVKIPALFFLGFWFLQQFLMGAMSLGVRTAETGGVAWWAHIGGFVAGVVLLRLLGGRRRPRPAVRGAWWQDDPRPTH